MRCYLTRDRWPCQEFREPQVDRPYSLAVGFSHCQIYIITIVFLKNQLMGWALLLYRDCVESSNGARPLTAFLCRIVTLAFDESSLIDMYDKSVYNSS